MSSSGEDSNSMIPEALRKEYFGYPLWQILLVLVVVYLLASKMGALPLAATSFVPSIFQPNATYSTDAAGKIKPLGAYYY